MPGDHCKGRGRRCRKSGSIPEVLNGRYADRWTGPWGGSMMTVAQMVCAGFAVAALSSGGQAADITLERPADREFVRDMADMLTPNDEQEIRTLCDKLLTDKATPIIVLTIDRMQDHGGEGMRIETFARLLFDQWQIGHAELNGQIWNTGILLLVSQGDRKARIELGAGWKRDKDQLCLQIMNEQIIPRFKQQDFSGGIKAGVIALDAMARELTLPASAVPKRTKAWWEPLLTLGLIALAIFSAVSLYRRGSGGWAWLMWAGLFSVLGYMLYQFLNSSRSSGGSGGSFGGGSFGGGFSGGGGASGSW
jgi:uncharacterized protein